MKINQQNVYIMHNTLGTYDSDANEHLLGGVQINKLIFKILKYKTILFFF